MKSFFIVFVIMLSIISCKTKNINSQNSSKSVVGDTVKIANKELEYEVIIIDVGFSNWLISRAFPRNYHSESFLENKNNSMFLSGIEGCLILDTTGIYTKCK